MGNVSKVIVTILLIIGFFVIGVVLQEAGIDQIFLVMLAFGLFYGIKSMFKSNKKNTESDELTLKKD